MFCKKITEVCNLFNYTANKWCINTCGTTNFKRTMSDALEAIRKPRYDGRTKKRQWEFRRSTPLADEPNEKVFKLENVVKVKRRKFALLMGYSGANYFGMQRNPQALTIEEELFKAMLKCEYITSEAYNQAQTIQFQRAARTDKGVSAARQVVSLKLPETTEVSKINECLPDEIRVFAKRRVTKGFNSKSQCDARTYMYMLPTVAFSNPSQSTPDLESYRISDDLHDRVNQVLSKFVGTKNFYNYTSKKKFHDPSSHRFILSFICDKPFVKDGVEFAVIKVKGQSFMLHQIRKMVGLTLAILRGHTTDEILTKSFTSERVNVPRAPGLGLVLEYIHYDRYNYRYGTDHDKLDWVEEENEVNTFKEKYIYPTIIETEIKEKQMLEWLEVLNFHSYDDIEDENDTKCDKVNADDDDNEQELSEEDEEKISSHLKQNDTKGISDEEKKKNPHKLEDNEIIEKNDGNERDEKCEIKG